MPRSAPAFITWRFCSEGMRGFVLDDATHEAVAIASEHNISGQYLVRILEQICTYRGYPQVIRTDNGRELCGRAMLTWAHEKQIALRLIEPGKPNQNAVESFNGRLRDECLNEHWFTSLTHARIVIEACDANTTRSDPRALCGLTPSAYAEQLAPRGLP